MSQFTRLLEEFSFITGIAFQAAPDDSCSIRINNCFSIQLKTDQGQEKLLIGCMICEVPPGKFRENVLKEALKENALPPPNPGIFAYIERNNHLFLYEFLFFQYLNGESLTEYLASFIEKCTAWYEAIQSGATSPHPAEVIVPNPSPLGIKP
ncbi:MAG: CesT family type III secretion system chaperone [Simkaniaceae bacterium]|nr:CesT family type III secretion system chaperone [Simkaniaceae bacterium]